ncbi:helix-turn-helix domain-containing protein [Candidatus Binatus soli]|jgi:excisionase family DNA binding protein|uniref:helix-turn-helix domain-containing protein n=1 Tax=Candidatus Binatus soli TaxID=1953413 RepID=UPI003D1451FD
MKTNETPNALAYTVKEAARLLHINANVAYQYTKKGILPSVRIGRSVRIPRLALEQFLADQSTGRAGGVR